MCDAHVQTGPCSGVSAMPKLFWTSAALPSHGPAHLAQPGFPLDKKFLLLMPKALFVFAYLSLFSPPSIPYLSGLIALNVCTAC